MGYVAVGMQRALDSAIGMPSMSTSAFWMRVLDALDHRTDRAMSTPPNRSTAAGSL